jgi:O-antigen ligase
MSLSLLLYLSAGALAPAIGFPGVALALGLWAALVTRRSILDGRAILSRTLLLFLAAFVALVVFSFPRWDQPVDLKDPAAMIVFFAIVPSLMVAFSLRDEQWLAAARTTLALAFVGFSVVVIAWAAVYGVDWQRNTFLLPTLHKNGVAATYEVLLLTTLLERRAWHQRAAVAALGLLCLALIGSKTGLGLAAIMILVILFRWAGAALVVVVLASSFGFIRANLALEGPLETAVSRFILWAHAWDQITESGSHLWFGVGPGTFLAPIQIRSLEGIAGTHNLVLQFWHSYGLLGLTLFGLFFLAVARRFGFTRSPFLAAFWLFNLHALFDVGWVKGAGFVAAAALGLGIADVLRREARAKTASPA